jgi:hypothetical protein
MIQAHEVPVCGGAAVPTPGGSDASLLILLIERVFPAVSVLAAWHNHAHGFA